MIRPGSNKATNNDKKYFKFKVDLRIDALGKSENNKILECFSGEGKLWRSVSEQTKKELNIFKIDADEKFNADYIGNSLTFLKKSNLEYFGIIDLDSWGSPFNHIEILIKKKYKGVVICTFCSPVSINPCGVLAKSYYGKIYESTKRRSILCKNTKMIENYLSKNQIHKYYGFVSDKKSYFYFTM